MSMNNQIAKNIIETVKKHEGFKSRPYKCPTGHDSIGYGFKMSDLYLEEDIAHEMLVRILSYKEKQMRDTFDWIDETQNNNVSGFIAQEVKQVLPNLVDGTEYDPTFNDESLGSKGGIKSVGYSINTVGVTAHLTKALQEAIAKIEVLEAKVAALEGS